MRNESSRRDLGRTCQREPPNYGSEQLRRPPPRPNWRLRLRQALYSPAMHLSRSPTFFRYVHLLEAEIKLKIHKTLLRCAPALQHYSLSSALENKGSSRPMCQWPPRTCQAHKTLVHGTIASYTACPSRNLASRALPCRFSYGSVRGIFISRLAA